MNKGFKELDIKITDQVKIINMYEALRTDENVKSEDLVTKAVELVKSFSDKPGLWDRVFNPEKVKSWQQQWGTTEPEKPKVKELTADEIMAGTIPGTQEQKPIIQNRKSLNEIFGK